MAAGLAMLAANGAMRKSTDAAAVAGEAKKLQALFQDVQQFWAGRNNKEAADWAASANNMESVTAHKKELGGVCQTCHAKNREKTENGFAIKKA